MELGWLPRVQLEDLCALLWKPWALPAKYDALMLVQANYHPYAPLDSAGHRTDAPGP